MKPSPLLSISLAVTLITVLNARAAVDPKGDGTALKEADPQCRLLSLPLHFEKNEGQTDSTVSYLARGKGYALFLTANEAVLRLSSPSSRGDARSPAGSNLQTPAVSALRLRLLGANPGPGIFGIAQSAGKVNYFKGSDPAQWRTDVPTYGQVKYQHIYPGIDLVFYGNSQQEFEYDFVVAPGADPNQIKLGFTGADNIKIADNGDLVLRIGGRQIMQRKPRVYQFVNGRQREIAGSYALHRDGLPLATDEVLVAFSLADHDTKLPLIIDPVLSYSTYLGGSDTDAATGIAVDTAGNAYVAGWTASPDFPTNNAIDGSLVGPFDRDAFVVKLTPDGSGFVYATYLGGSSGEGALAIAVDGDGNAYIAGDTGHSADFPTVNAFQSTSTGNDAFLAKLSGDGSTLLYSTKLGGTAGYQQGSALAAASNGIVWIAGTTSSPNFPTRNALQPVFQGGGPNNRGDVFVARFDTTLSGDASLIYATYLGGNDEDDPKGIALDAAGNAYVSGYTASTNFPTTVGVFQPVYAGGDYDVFVARLNPSGTSLVYSTYLGGTNRDSGGGLAVDSQGNAYVTGQTSSDDFPTKNAWQPTRFSRWGNQIGGNGFVSKLNPDGSDLVYATFLLGVADARGIAVDQADSAYVTGITRENLPTVNAAQTNYGGADDAFLLKLDPDGQSPLYATYLGGTGGDGCTGIAIDPNGSAYVAGYTSSTNFPTRNAIQPAFVGGAVDAFVASISDPDTNPPVILAASNYGDSNVVTIDFSEALNLASATNATHYALDHGVTVGSVMMGVNSKTVRLVTSGLNNGVTYTLTVNDVLDRAPVPNSIAPDTQLGFTAMGLYRGFLQQEVYAGIDGGSGQLADLTNNVKYPDHPDKVANIHEFEILQGANIRSGVRVSGYLLPPVTGDYTFYLCTMRQGAFYLSRNESPLNKILIGLEPNGVAGNGNQGRLWNHPLPGYSRSPLPNVSLPIHLEAGKAYYVEALGQTDTAGDMLAVTWQVPGQPVPWNGDSPIIGNYLALLGNPQNATLTVTQEPQDVTLAEGQTAAFSLKATASPAGIFYQWRKNGLKIPGANGTSFITPEGALAEDGDLYDCVLTIPGTTATTRSALLTVTNDVTPPLLVSAEGNLTWTNLTLTFSEPVNFADVTNTANYTLSGGLTVSNAILLVDRRTVILTTSPQTPGSNYAVQVSGIRDRSAAGNSVTAGTQSPFFGWVDEEFVGPFASWANVKEVYGAVGDGVADDTAALQQALNEVATPDHAAVLYFPTGTYRITQTLNLNSRISASLVGEDTVSTIIKWDGPTNADMMFANSVAYSRWTRLTWYGSGKAGCAVHHGYTSGFWQVTGNVHTDEIFKDIGTGLAADPANGGDTHTIVRCHFLRCSSSGIAVGSYNVIDWHVWDSLFEDCKYGLRSYAGNFHVYRSLFLRSTEMDIYCSGTEPYFGIRGNMSIGSKAFVEGFFTAMTIQGNTILDSLDPVSVRGTGPVTLLDNTFRSRADATSEPVVNVDANLLSVGNTFTVEKPIAVAGRSIMMEDQVVNRDSLGLPTPMVPGFLPNRLRPVIEVPTDADAAAIQQAIDMAAGMNGSRPVVHLPSGIYYVNRTLVIPAGCDVQFVGDGFIWRTATQLQWIGPPGDPLLRLAGPSRATLREFSVSGGGVVVENCDQPEARVFMEHVYSDGSDVNLLVDRLDNTDVSMHVFAHNVAAEVSVRVIGGTAQAAGLTTSGRVDIFGGGSGVSALTYQVEHGGRLMAQDLWYEGHELTNFMRLTDSGTFTLNNAQIAVGDALSGVGGDRAVELNDFHGQASFLNTAFTFSGTVVSGDGSDTDLLLLGCTGFHVSDTPWLVNQSPNATVERLMSSSNGLQTPDVGEADPIFLRKMLSQVRTETPRRLVPLPPGVTDVRLFRVDVSGCRVGIKLTGMNARPQLAAVPDQIIDEGATLSVTNVGTDADLPYQTLAYSLAASAPYGASVNPTNGVFTWTPREEQGPSTNFIQVVVADDGSPSLTATNGFTVIVQEVNTPPQLGVPDPAAILQAGDIGSLGDPLESGSSLFNPDGSISVVAGGSQLAASDHLHFTYQKVAGDFDVRVQVSSLEPRNTFSFAGLMARETLEADSRFFNIQVRPVGPTLDGQYGGQGYGSYGPVCRESSGTFTGWGGDSAGVPYPNAWLRLKRQGDTFSSFRSTNGIDWTPLADRTVPVPFLNELFLGLATCSANNGPGQTTHAEYLNYGPFPPPPPSPLKDWSINEGETLSFRVPAYDTDLPFQRLTFSLHPGAPGGASIDPVSGLFTWTPPEAPEPSTNTITIRVSDDGLPPMSATHSFTIIVLKSNSPPLLPASRFPSLIHRYGFSGNADDSVGSAHGILQSGSSVNGGQLVLDGSSAYVDLPNNLVTGLTSITIETWVADAGSGGWARIFDFGNSTAGENQQGNGTQYMFLTLPSGAGNLRGAYSLNGSGSNEQLVEWPSGRPPVGQKTHIVMTTDGVTHAGRLYVNGVLVGSNNNVTITPAALGPTVNNWLGRSQWNDPYFNGAIDEFRIYNTALSAADVQAHFLFGPEVITSSLLPAPTINELTTLTLTNAATDPDLPVNTLNYSLVSPPDGATINTSGVITWTPSDNQGPGSYIITTVVTDDGVPAWSATNTFTVVVNEVNTTPVLTLPPNTNINELVPFTANATATDADIPTNALVFARVDGPAGLTVSSSGVIDWTPTEVQGSNAYTVLISVTDTNPLAINEKSFRVTNSFEITVNEVNLAPLLAVPTDQTINELDFHTNNATATDADLPANALHFALVSGPSNLTVYADAGISWTPAEEQGPSTNVITVRVTDDSPFAVNSQQLSMTNSFTLIVNEVNVAPLLTLPPNTNINEMVAFTASATATDPDIPTNALTFALVSGPASLTVSPSGVINWMPDESQGPSTNTVTISVTDTNPIALNATSLSVTSSFQIIVSEVNVAPELGALSNYTVNAGQTVSFTATATDADLPTNTLSFSLLSPPPGATITSGGWFNWRPMVARANTTNVLRVMVQDNGAPVSNDTRSFSVIANPLGAPVVLTPLGFASGQFTLAVTGPLGPDYVLTGSTNLLQWSDLITNHSPTLPFQHTDTNAGSFSNRAYRVRLEP